MVLVLIRRKDTLFQFFTQKPKKFYNNKTMVYQQNGEKSLAKMTHISLKCYYRT